MLLDGFLVERATLVLIKVVVDFIEEAGEIFQQIMDLLAAFGCQLGIKPDLIDRNQPRLSELDHQLDAIVGIHGSLAKLVCLGFSEGITSSCGGGHAQQQQQKYYLGGNFHFFSFLGAANMDSRTSSVSFSSCFSTA